MRVWQSGLLGAAAIALMASGAPRRASQWHDDGTVDLMLGPDYDDAVITTTREQLGELFGPDQKPFEGAEISVTVNSSGPKGGISGPLHAFRPIWEELSGGTLNIVELPFGEHYTKMMLDLRNGTGEYDAFMVGAFWYGDIAPAGYGFPIDDFMASPEYPQWTYDSMPPALARRCTSGATTRYGVLNDADGQVLYYRRDALSNPEHQQAFKAEYGYDLPAPPKTWQQLLDIARYFNGKNWDANDAEPDSGMVLHLKVGEQGHYHFQSLSASFAITPGDKVDQYHNVYWFDPTDMTPLINSPGHVKALEFLQELHKTGPSAQVSWSLGEAWDYFLRGKAVFVFSWGDVGALCQDPARSKIQGVCAASILPASNEYYDHETKEFVQVDDPQPVGNTTGGSWHGVISNFSANPEATYSLLALMAIKEVSMWNAQHGWTGVDPGYSYQFLRARGRGDGRGLRQGRLGRRGRQDLHQGLLRQLLRRHDADLPAHPRHLRVLGHPRQEPVRGDGGEMSAKQALDNTAASWEQVTDRIGRDSQLKDYQEAIGYDG